MSVGLSAKFVDLYGRILALEKRGFHPGGQPDNITFADQMVTGHLNILSAALPSNRSIGFTFVSLEISFACLAAMQKLSHASEVGRMAGIDAEY
jgi:hypothetical protein